MAIDRKFLQEVRNALSSTRQSELDITCESPSIIIEGNFLVLDSSPNEPIGKYEVKIVLGYDYPKKQPKVFEIGNRIPRQPDYHINNQEGECCICIWEAWLAKNQNISFAEFIQRPLHQFFLGQLVYEKKRRWPFGERSHGEKGVLEECTEILNLPFDKEKIIRHLLFFTRKNHIGFWPKGHWICPCGSGRIIRKCDSQKHVQHLSNIHKRISPTIAASFLRKIQAKISKGKSS